MHIAICDDNVADRKQLERLLERESDLRSNATGTLYTDSFGNCNALMQSPISYDMFFIDMTETMNGIEIAGLLRDADISVPIVLCSSKIDYRVNNCELPSVYYLDKPINANHLSVLISKGLEVKKQARPTFELRGRSKTIYITAEDFLYAEEINDRQAVIALYDGRKTDFLDSLPKLWLLLSSHPSIVALRKKYLVNVSYIKKITLFSITMTNNKKIYIRLHERRELKKYSKNFML